MRPRPRSGFVRNWAPACAGATACHPPTSVLRSLRRGFTLIEALVALAVIALAMTALLASGARMARDQQRFEQVSLAAYAADTVLTETRLKEPFPATGRREGLSAIGHYRFRWEMVVQATPEASIRRLDLHVYPDPRPADAAAIVSLSGFAGQP
ncbi:MAG: type II secretion system minor pseudopilin GspI [Gammaproteobacteria bacterium]